MSNQFKRNEVTQVFQNLKYQSGNQTTMEAKKPFINLQQVRGNTQITNPFSQQQTDFTRNIQRRTPTIADASKQNPLPREIEQKLLVVQQPAHSITTLGAQTQISAQKILHQRIQPHDLPIKPLEINKPLQTHDIGPRVRNSHPVRENPIIQSIQEQSKTLVQRKPMAVNTDSELVVAWPMNPSHVFVSKTPQTKSNNFAYNKFPLNDHLVTPRANHLKLIGSNYRPKEDIIVQRISRDMSSTPQTLKLKKVEPDVTKVVKIQSFFRRKHAQIMFKKLLKKSRYRMSVFNEIIKTEEIYVNDLIIIFREFIVEIRNRKLQSELDIQRCFVNISAIIELNKELLQALKQNPWHPNRQVIQIFLGFAPFFKIYFEYCNNYQTMNTQIHKFKQDAKFLQFYKEVAKSPLFRNLDIESFLVKPVQRLPKYVLLLKDYLKHTDGDHVDYPNIQKALDIFNQVNEGNNKNMDRVIMNAKMFELQKSFGDINSLIIVDPKRDFLLEEPMTVFWRNLPKSVIVYFLSDMLLITEMDLQTNDNQQMRLLSPFYISEISFLKDLPDHDNFRFMFSLIGKPETITFLCEDASSKKKITDVLQSMIDKFGHINNLRQEAYGKMSTRATNLPKKKIHKIEVEVLGSEERSDTFSSYTIYIIEVSIEGIVCNIFLRYKEFTELQNLTKKLFPSLSLPYSTDKNWMSKNDSKIIEARKLQIQIFLQSLIGNPEFYDNLRSSQVKDIQTILKYVGLPQNFYELPLLLNDYEKSCQKEETTPSASKNTSFISNQISTPEVRPSYVPLQYRDIQQGKTITQIKDESTININQRQAKRIHTSLNQDYQWRTKNLVNLPEPGTICSQDDSAIPLNSTFDDASRSGRSMIRGDNCATRKVSATKLMQSSMTTKQSAQQVKFTLMVKLSNQSIELQITDNCRALEVAEQVASKIGLLQYYDFKFVDEKSGRYIQDDELLLSIFRNKEQAQDSIISFNILQKVKNALQQKYTLLFKKVLFLSKIHEGQEYLLDGTRRQILVSQLTNDIMNMKISLNFKEYCTVAALQVFIIQIETNSRQISYEQIQKFIPSSLLKATKKEIWINQVTDQLARCRQQIETETQIQVKDKVEDAANIKIMIAQRVIMHNAQQYKLYGFTLFTAENCQENKFKNTQIPPLISVGVSIDGIHLIDQQTKNLLYTFSSDSIEQIRVFTNYFEIEVYETLEDNSIFRFNTTQSYQIYQLHEEYQQVLLEIEQAFNQ